VPLPSGGGTDLVGVERKERLRGVDRFAGRLLGAVSAFRNDNFGPAGRPDHLSGNVT